MNELTYVHITIPLTEGKEPTTTTDIQRRNKLEMAAMTARMSPKYAGQHTQFSKEWQLLVGFDSREAAQSYANDTKWGKPRVIYKREDLEFLVRTENMS